MPPLTPIDAESPVGAVLLCYPQTLRVFKRFGMDVYRDWPMTLGEVAAADGMDLAALLRSLRGAGARPAA